MLVLLLSLAHLTSCVEDEKINYATFNEMSVTVQGNDLVGFKLYTDFDAILIPTNMDLLPRLKEVSRAQISFDTPGGPTDITDFKVGQTYNIRLNAEGVNREIPTFNNSIDIMSKEYMTNGQDSVSLKNKAVNSIDQTSGRFYIKNGYLNLVSTFDVSPDKVVYFSLYYNSEEDVDPANKKLTLRLYFNNNTETPYGSTTSPLSFRMPEDIYNQFLYEGMGEDETITVSLKVDTRQNGNCTLDCTMKVRDFALPEVL